MLNPILSSLKAESLDRMIRVLSGSGRVAVRGVPEAQAAILAACLRQRTGKRVLVIQNNDLKTRRALEDLTALLGQDVAMLPSADIDLTRGISSQEQVWRRLEVLDRLDEGTCGLLLTSADALMQRMGNPEAYHQAVRTFHTGDRCSPTELMEHLTHSGYERVTLVEGKGQCAMRGDILDVFPPASVNALRLEFFDDELDSIRLFDSISQRSLNRVETCRIPPAEEIVLTREEAISGALRMRACLGRFEVDPRSGTTRLLDSLPPLPEDAEEEEEVKILPETAPEPKAYSESRRSEIAFRLSSLRQEAELLENTFSCRHLRAWQTVVMDRTWRLQDIFCPEIVIFCEPDQLRSRIQERQAGFAEDLRGAMERGEAVKEQENLLMSWEECARGLLDKPGVVFSDLTGGLGGIQVTDALEIRMQNLPGYTSQIRLLAEDLKNWQNQRRTVLLLSGAEARGERLKMALSELGIAVFLQTDLSAPVQEGSVTVLPISMSRGFVWEEGHLCVISDTDIYGASYHRNRSRRRSGEKISAFSELNVGDYVVHEDHGIGLYQGTVQLRNDGVTREYLLIQYAGADKLYVPVEQLQRIQRYIGTPSAAPKLNSIGGKEWSTSKRKLKESLKKIAFDLVKLYARRSHETGHAFAPDTIWQRQFEDQFPFELTPDQAQSVQEIKADMESAHNMDRLLCGDVGYGKTEVSLRAAFKCIMDGRQVAILAPTTILAQQHYNTIVKRFSGFPVNVEVLSRFRSTAQQKAVISRLAAGSVDIVVGTHRLLGKDVKFSRLGLLIVDEEQRFGVSHKEQIKNMKSQVDVLTLSATPIPRTLHMSMVGIRDMSVLETPPEDRLPVQTHVVEYSDTLIRDAILRELSRNGQVYFLYNRVQSIERFYERLHQLVPEARIGLAHGQMNEKGLEEVMMDFYSGSYDVLLCTTIIESGLDVPTANTLIVFDAERFGLSQLYQLRGRVGRSSRQAYTYFTVRPDRNLSETAQKRLQAIRDFTEFGSGFRIAMRDLEIRGAGNLLGPEQHGHLASVGYEMYCKLIEEAMKEAQGGMDRSDLETRVDLRVNAYLPSSYIRDSSLRMEIYRRIASLTTDADRSDIIDELVDRFGDIPPEVETLLDVAQLRSICHDLGVSNVLHREDSLLMRLQSSYVTDPHALVLALQKTDKRLSITHKVPESILLTVPGARDPILLREGIRVMGRVLENYEQLLQEKRESS